MDRQQAYLDENAKGYEGDSFIHGEIKQLCEKFAVEIIIETGTFRGATTKRLAELAKRVYTIESNKEYADFARKNLQEIENAVLQFGNSAKELPFLLDNFSPKTSYLFFLDAHWHDYCPLLDELKAISDRNIKPVIFIHDFKVPGRPDLGFDSYNGQDFEFSYIKEAIEAIYGDNYDYHYNDEADGAKRGVIYIYPIN